MKYTKGDWIAEPVGNEGKCVIHTGDLSRPFAHTFTNRYRKPQVSSEEALANAQLIASAPDLYEACKDFIVNMGIDHRDYKSFEEAMKPIVARIQQALAKAEGK